MREKKRGRKRERERELYLEGVKKPHQGENNADIKMLRM